jgi:hypothetical protein
MHAGVLVIRKRGKVTSDDVQGGVGVSGNAITAPPTEGLKQPGSGT